MIEKSPRNTQIVVEKIPKNGLFMAQIGNKRKLDH